METKDIGAVKASSEKVILGIDPGTNIMGYGLLRVERNPSRAVMMTMGVIDLRRYGDGYLKLGHIFERVTGIIDEWLPDEMAITGNGSASKEQVAGMLQRLLKIKEEEMGKFMDATDALAAAYCHYLQIGRPESPAKYRGWKDFVNKNRDKVSKRQQP